MREFKNIEEMEAIKLHFNRVNGTKIKAVPSNLGILNRAFRLEDWEGEFDEFIDVNKATNLQDFCLEWESYKKHGGVIANPFVSHDDKPNEEPITPATPSQESENVPKTAPTASAVISTGNPLVDALNASLAGIAQDMFANRADEILGSLQTHIDKKLEDACAHVVKKIDLMAGGRKTTVDGILHKRFPQVLELVNADIPVFLTGPAGTGKNVLASQIAQALNLNFYFTGAVSQEYKITGFIDANGTYQETQFYKAFKDGGLFFLDEIDASVPEVLVALNAALANRYFDFPIGKVDAHPEFRVIAAGNTYGLGADAEYVGRYQLDAATLDRFALIRVDYDKDIELACAGGDSDLVTFAHEFRKVCKDSGIKAMCTYRAISRIATLKESKQFSLKEVIELSLLKNLQKDDLNVIRRSLHIEGNKYSEAIA